MRIGIVTEGGKTRVINPSVERLVLLCQLGEKLTTDSLKLLVKEYALALLNAYQELEESRMKEENEINTRTK